MKKHCFTVILPLRNGGEYLKECVQSVLAQTYPNFELAILENCSGDGSHEWLQNLQDSRIKIYPSDDSLDIEKNWSRALSIPRQEYMTFIGHDDKLTPNFLQVLNELINSQPDASLYQTHYQSIDQNGNAFGSVEKIPDQENASELLRAFLTFQRKSYSGFAMSSAHYDQVGGIPAFPRLLWADVVLWLRLTQISYKATAPETCFLLRVHPDSVGVSSQWSSILAALDKFSDFLLEDKKHAKIIGEHAPGYFLQHAQLIYLLALVEATKNNTQIEPTVLPHIRKAMGKISPELSAQVGNTRSLRIRSFINQYSTLRSVYRRYIQWRYGQEHL